MHIYYFLVRRYAPHITLLPDDDVRQELEIAKFQSEGDFQKGLSIFRRNVDRLASDYGIKQRKGKGYIFEGYLPEGIDIQNPKSVEQTRLEKGIYILYRVVGKSNFIKMFCPENVPPRTFEKWCNAALAGPGLNKNRIFPVAKKVAMQMLCDGGEIRIGVHGSVYIHTNEGRARFSDHPASENFKENLTNNFIIN